MKKYNAKDYANFDDFRKVFITDLRSDLVGMEVEHYEDGKGTLAKVIELAIAPERPDIVCEFNFERSAYVYCLRANLISQKPLKYSSKDESKVWDCIGTLKEFCRQYDDVQEERLRQKIKDYNKNNL